MDSPFLTSLRRDASDPRSLLERIDAQLKERIEEACEFFCLDLLVQLRDAHGRPAPQPDNPTDRNEFKQLDLEKLKDLLKKPVIYDGRNIYDPALMKEMGFIYHGVGRGYEAE